MLSFLYCVGLLCYTITNAKLHCVFDSFNLGVRLASLSDPKIITAESGQNVTLPCRASSNNFIILQWSRADLGTQHVVVYRDGQFAPDDQHPSFKNRIDLRDGQMKDGDVSLILKNVTNADNGTYECRVFMGEIHSWELNIISLSVVDPPGEIMFSFLLPKNCRAWMDKQLKQSELNTVKQNGSS
uniref:Ig-like domain-containing protein n=1 Tax=Neolamprologus brichardi TaxID=32507 RepID=A0A3Q4HY01_NEOBR